jgi:hypothetical protein
MDYGQVGAALRNPGPTASALDNCNTTREPLVRRALNDLEKRLHALRDAADKLQARLAPVMRQEPAQAVAKNGVPQTRPPCDLAANIEEQAGHVSHVDSMLREVMELLEV